MVGVRTNNNPRLDNRRHGAAQGGSPEIVGQGQGQPVGQGRIRQERSAIFEINLFNMGILAGRILLRAGGRMSWPINEPHREQAIHRPSLPLPYGPAPQISQ